MFENDRRWRCTSRDNCTCTIRELADLVKCLDIFGHSATFWSPLDRRWRCTSRGCTCTIRDLADLGKCLHIFGHSDTVWSSLDSRCWWFERSGYEEIVSSEVQHMGGLNLWCLTELTQGHNPGSLLQSKRTSNERQGFAQPEPLVIR